MVDRRSQTSVLTYRHCTRYPALGDPGVSGARGNRRARGYRSGHLSSHSQSADRARREGRRGKKAPAGTRYRHGRSSAHSHRSWSGCNGALGWSDTRGTPRRCGGVVVKYGKIKLKSRQIKSGGCAPIHPANHQPSSPQDIILPSTIPPTPRVMLMDHGQSTTMSKAIKHKGKRTDQFQGTALKMPGRIKHLDHSPQACGKSTVRPPFGGWVPLSAGSGNTAYPSFEHHTHTHTLGGTTWRRVITGLPPLTEDEGTGIAECQELEVLVKAEQPET
ncbi:hypothetical protein DFP72DRAFT_851270 [Ephemerocybe angulata]|uniref:Uncharacterized protein n=1 Tax=Ephemerocybe angulata TaxID=980116 RepID=A0A8H6M2P7_9AGAR|nr:hypothetical protein DFP72DRAFT_851270 [Tulosesus angulatus]